jgi:hypothetical protein
MGLMKGLGGAGFVIGSLKLLWNPDLVDWKTINMSRLK